MARTAKWLGLALLPIIAVVAGSYSYYQYRVTHSLELAIDQVRPWVQISYGSASADFSGVITLKQVALLPAQGTGGVSAQRLTITTGGAGYLLAAADAGVTRWPDKATLKFSQLEFGLTPSNIILADSWSALLIPQGDVSSTLAMACGGHQPLSMRQLYEMGVESLSGSGELSFALDTSAEQIDTDLQLQFRELFRIQLASTLKTEMPQLSAAMLEGYPVWLDNAQLNYADNGYHGLRNNYCAGLDDDIVDQYMKLHRERVVEQLQKSGWQVGQKDIFDYQLLVSDRGSFQMLWQPEAPVDLSQLSETDWRLFRPSVRMGQHQIGLSSVIPEPVAIAKIQMQTELQAPGAGMTPVGDDASQRDATREAIRRAVKGTSQDAVVAEKTYREVSPERIDQFIGSWVRLETYFGRKVEGTLKRVDDNMLYIDEHVGQGSAMYPIDKTKLSGLQVLH